MKRILMFITLLSTTLFFTSCDEDNGPTDPGGEDPGSIFVESSPAGAAIWLNGNNTGLVTPDSITNVDPGTHQVTLTLEDYRDTTVAVNVNSNQTTNISVTLTSDFNLIAYGPVRIYETAGTTAEQPSGLDLSTGNAYGISGNDNVFVDIYYSTTGTGGEGYLVQSADLSPNMDRVTKFRVGNGTDLNDGEDSPDKNTGNWTNFMDDREDNYVFLYDNDGNYSKLKIVNWGGGGIGDPAWVEVQWWYNTTVDDPRF